MQIDQSKCKSINQNANRSIIILLFYYYTTVKYNIGTKNLIFYCFLTKIMNSFSISMIFSGICTKFRDLSFPRGRNAVGAT